MKEAIQAILTSLATKEGLFMIRHEKLHIQGGLVIPRRTGA